MKKKTAARFSVLEWGDPLAGETLRLLEVDSSQLRECMKYYEDTKLDGLYISYHHGYRRTDLTFLKDYPFVRHIVVAYSPDIRVSGLCELRGLRSICIADNRQPIDFSAFPELEDLSVDWHSKMRFPQRSEALKRLALRNYKPKSKDLTELPEFVNLEELTIIRSPLRSLAGLRRFRKLKHLDLSYLSKLERIGDLDAPSLEVVEFHVCKKICDHEHVATLPRVRVLRFGNCGQMPSLKFLDRMPRLEEFSFVDTNVVDGDLRPLFRLKYAGFLNRKHYSHTDEEVEAIIAERQRGGGGYQ